ncbi:M23 family metallopeptidase [Nitratireductor mangrovi]|uniref:M23 family metallopeptidase n=1 Tax=Nitratireductor mangrovi TaxID=2599600 RepID=A0A5B8L1C6_9HYPH|nr:M23 family metallopeptidase [Nitratireductor mangrovi]QDZ01817.1 M23 family metallopeptidase [Nitratireductor mangrovi]
MRQLLAVLIFASATSAVALELDMPADCVIGETCFLQQFADMDPGPGTVDPLCGAATYDGHKGTDIRLLSMEDIAADVAVLAMAPGRVLRVRDGVTDRLVTTDRDRQAAAGRECGNGIVMAHDGGFETQYCHLRMNSVAVKPGDRVASGDRLGAIGASGMAQFPHVHVAVRKDGVEIDPLTGRALGAGCGDDPSLAASLFKPAIARALAEGVTSVLALGLAGDVVDHAALTAHGPPPSATPSSGATVGWAWFSNLRLGDRIRLTVITPDGNILARQTTEPADRHKADYSAYAGKRGRPAPGGYRVSAELIRDGVPIFERSATVTIE